MDKASNAFVVLFLRQAAHDTVATRAFVEERAVSALPWTAAAAHAVNVERFVGAMMAADRSIIGHWNVRLSTRAPSPLPLPLKMPPTNRSQVSQQVPASLA